MLMQDQEFEPCVMSGPILTLMRQDTCCRCHESHGFHDFLGFRKSFGGFVFEWEGRLM